MDVWFLMYVVCSGTFYCICESTTSYGSDHEYRLVRDLTKSYNKQVKPSLHSNQALNISYGVALAQIIDL
ncbi:neuronal acetylcholine receptor subunit beta-3, partial [Biomphalaria glabrata]